MKGDFVHGLRLQWRAETAKSSPITHFIHFYSRFSFSYITVLYLIQYGG